ncbi:MAG: phosphotransferase [Ktedonobacterales bacterium]
MRPGVNELDAVQDEAREALAAWGLHAGEWRVAQLVPGMQGAVLRPVVEIGGARYLLRCQPPDLTEDDIRFQQAFMRHLTDAGLPVPTLLPRPDGHTYAIVSDGIYELQHWAPGERFTTDDLLADQRIIAAGQALGALHQVSADFAWEPHSWPEERSAPALAQAYARLIREAAQHWQDQSALANGLERVADACEERIDDAVDALAIRPGPPQLHIHGDYQPHNLAFTGAAVAAIYDFDTAHWDQRILELAYSLCFFTGVQWTTDATVTPPLADDGLDIQRAQRYLAAYGKEAPPAIGEATLLGDALALAFPIVFANGAAEDLIFPGDFEGEMDEEDALARLEWADRFWLWLDRYRDALTQAWQNG